MTSADDVLRQADQLWSVLNDLSENDPAAYRRFIEKQMKEGADFSSPPELHCSLRTELLVSSLTRCSSLSSPHTDVFYGTLYGCVHEWFCF